MIKKILYYIFLWPLNRRKMLGALLTVSIAANAQKVFIGMTPDQVYDYWSTRVSVTYFDTFEDTINKTSTFVIARNSAPDFDANFVNGKCIKHSTKVTWEDQSVFESKIQKAGFFYDKKQDAWFNSAKTLTWKMEPASDFAFYVCEKTQNPAKPGHSPAAKSNPR